jgi:Uncharacterized conserved protein
MVLQGIQFLPVTVNRDQALNLFKILADVNKKLGILSSELEHSIANENLMQVFSLIESTQSTRIEGTQVTFTEVLEEKGSKNHSSEIKEVLNYQEALSEGIEKLRGGYPLSTRLMKDLHKILMDGSRGTSSGSGEFRKIQNHIGPDNKIENAVYVPVPPNVVNEYMTNLEYFINNEAHRTFREIEDENLYVFDESTPDLIKAGIIHAQFESIHPFIDGNGRLGRILIILTLLKEKAISKPIFFVSEELEKERARYYDLLNGVRGSDPEWYPWLKFFLESSLRMIENLLKKIRESEQLARSGAKKLKGKEVQVWLFSFTQPTFKVIDAANYLGLSPKTVREKLSKLVDLELLYTDKVTKRNKQYHNYDFLRILNQ